MANEYILEKFDSGMHYILLDNKTVVAFTKHGYKRVLCRMNDQAEFHCAFMPREEVGHFITHRVDYMQKIKN